MRDLYDYTIDREMKLYNIIKDSLSIGLFERYFMTENGKLDRDEFFWACGQCCMRLLSIEVISNDFENYCRDFNHDLRPYVKNTESIEYILTHDYAGVLIESIIISLGFDREFEIVNKMIDV